MDMLEKLDMVCFANENGGFGHIYIHEEMFANLYYWPSLPLVVVSSPVIPQHRFTCQPLLYHQVFQPNTSSIGCVFAATA